MHYVQAKHLLSQKNGMNIYRGCTHGCIYCDSRSVCYGMKHDFEDVEIKQNAPELLEEELRRKRRRCMVGTGSMSDPYQPLEAEQMLTRRCLELIARRGFGLAIQTKSDLILRDIELLQSINDKSKCVAQLTLTTFDEALCHLVEPNVCGTKRRYEVLKKLQEAGIPTVVWLCPLLPFINDTEENLSGILEYCFDAGVKGILSFGMGVTLREGDREYFYHALDRHFPGMRQRYIHMFGSSYECASTNSAALERLFRQECERRGVMYDTKRIFDCLYEYNDKQSGEQLKLW